MDPTPTYTYTTYTLYTYESLELQWVEPPLGGALTVK